MKARLPGLLYIKWITDKQTGEFYGSSFLEMKDAASSALAVLQDKTKFLGRYVLHKVWSYSAHAELTLRFTAQTIEAVLLPSSPWRQVAPAPHRQQQRQPQRQPGLLQRTHHDESQDQRATSQREDREARGLPQAVRGQLVVQHRRRDHRGLLQGVRHPRGPAVAHPQGDGGVQSKFSV